jgi:hypothetical protein
MNKGGSALLVLLPSEEKIAEMIQSRKIPLEKLDCNPEKQINIQPQLQVCRGGGGEGKGNREGARREMRIEGETRNRGLRRGNEEEREILKNLSSQELCLKQTEIKLLAQKVPQTSVCLLLPSLCSVASFSPSLPALLPPPFSFLPPSSFSPTLHCSFSSSE